MRQAITAMKQLSAAFKQPTQQYDGYLDNAVAAFDTDRVFAGYYKLSNTAMSMLEDVTDRKLRNALSSIAFHGYTYCVEQSDGSSDFTKSRSHAERTARGLGGPLSCSEALGTIHEHLSVSEAASLLAAVGEAPTATLDGVTLGIPEAASPDYS